MTASASRDSAPHHDPQDLARRAAVHAALSEPTRLAIADALVLGDRTAGELAAAVGISRSLASHHLKVLQTAGVVVRRRSAGDARRQYVTLCAPVRDDVGLRPASVPARRVLFVCTANSARSQMAEALWRCHSPIPATSAGRQPAARVHPRAVAAAARGGVDLGAARPRAYPQVGAGEDLIVSVCDMAGEADLPPARHRLHWSIPDPVPAGTDEAFDAALADLEPRVTRLADHLAGR